MQQTFSADQLTAIADRVCRTLRLEPVQVQIVVLMAVLASLIRLTDGPLPGDLVAMLPVLERNVMQAAQAFATVGVNVGEAH